VRKVILTQILNPENSEYSANQTIRKSENLTIRDSADPSFQSFQKKNDGKSNEKLIEELATELLPVGQAYEWNQALMDYAAAFLKKEKIPIPKQSKFHGSHRYYRGQVLKVLLKKKTIAVKDLGPLIKKDYTDSEGKWLQKLLDELQKEGFLILQDSNITLST